MMKALMLIYLGLKLLGLNEHSQPRTGQARVVIYRQREFGGNNYKIKINDKALGSLPTNRYFQVDVDPGKIKVESAKDYFSTNQTLWLTAQAGQTYYIKAVEDVDFLSRTLLMTTIHQEQALREIHKIKPLNTAVSATN
jgi:hypothetical protein